MEADEKSAYYMCKLGGPQHGEFRKEILQTMQVGLGPTWKLTKSQLPISEYKTLTKNMQTITST